MVTGYLLDFADKHEWICARSVTPQVIRVGKHCETIATQAVWLAHGKTLKPKTENMEKNEYEVFCFSLDKWNQRIMV